MQEFKFQITYHDEMSGKKLTDSRPLRVVRRTALAAEYVAALWCVQQRTYTGYDKVTYKPLAG